MPHAALACLPLSLPICGNLVPDAWYAALAIESGSEWIFTQDHSGEKSLFRHEFMHLFVYMGQQFVNLRCAEALCCIFGANR